MGGGDIKYMAAMGLWLGLFPTIAALLIAFIMGGLIGVLLIALRIKNRKDHIPFGPFLVFGSIVGYFFFEEFCALCISTFVVGFYWNQLLHVSHIYAKGQMQDSL